MLVQTVTWSRFADGWGEREKAERGQCNGEGYYLYRKLRPLVGRAQAPVR